MPNDDDDDDDSNPSIQNSFTQSLFSHITKVGYPLSDGIPLCHYTKSSSARDNLGDEVLQQEC